MKILCLLCQSFCVHGGGKNGGPHLGVSIEIDQLGITYLMTTLSLRYRHLGLRCGCCQADARGLIRFRAILYISLGFTRNFYLISLRLMIE
jgi:hypothetical protein